ncbi:MAG: hypothetical protein PPFGHCPK_01483 (plasmid) [Spiroplasma endosymbiont of Drosophila atripex]|nr:MAG: hypothetical protein PPFGHCPK_01483 [Spiroplasma endosymbiont of Drosophila atripex]
MKNIYEYHIHKNEIINDSKLLPTDKESQNYDWLWANNNKYENIEINSKKVGKWILICFLLKKSIHDYDFSTLKFEHKFAF